MTGKKEYKREYKITGETPAEAPTWDREFRLHVEFKQNTTQKEWISVWAPSRVEAKKKVDTISWKILAIREV